VDVKTLEYHIISRNTREHDEEQPAALENHNMIQTLRESKHDKVNESVWIKFI